MQISSDLLCIYHKTLSILTLEGSQIEQIPEILPQLNSKNQPKTQISLRQNIISVLQNIISVLKNIISELQNILAELKNIISLRQNFPF